MSLDDIKRKRAEDATSRDASNAATAKALKERNQKKIQTKLADKGPKRPAGGKKDQPKAAATNIKAGKVGGKGAGKR